MATEQRVHHPSEETLLRCAVALEELIYGDDSSLDIARSIVDRSIKSYSDDQITKVGQYAFNTCENLTAVSLPVCTSLGDYAFGGCSSLASVELPACTSLGDNTFSYCTSLTSVELPACTSIFGWYTFANCTNLSSVNLPACTNLRARAFQNCTSLKSIELPTLEELDDSEHFYQCDKLQTIDFGGITSSIPEGCFSSCYSLTAVIIRTTYKVIGLSSTGAFSNCYHFHGTVDATYNPDGLKDGYIYVPDTLVDSYKTATNWVTLADQIKPLSELPTK